MIATKWLVLGCAVFALSTALPLNIGGLGDTLSSLTLTIDSTLGGVLGTVDDLLQNLSAEVATLLKDLTKILNIPVGQNPLSFITSLTSELEAIVEQLMSITSTAQLNKIVAQLTQLLNVADGINLESFLAKLIVQLDSFLQQVLTVVSRLVADVKQVTDQLPAVGQLLNDSQVIQLVQRLIFTLKLVLFLVNLFIKLGGLGLLV